MAKAVSLLSLCNQVVANELIHSHGHQLEQVIFELPSDLFDNLIIQLPPLALHKLHQHICPCTDDDDSLKNGRKRGRYDDLDMAWKILFKARWPDGGRKSHSVDQLTKQGMVELELKNRAFGWHHMYWEAHLQDCLDIAAEKAVLPSFDRCIGEIKIPGSIIESIGHKRCKCGSTCGYSKLAYHCLQYGCYARSLRLQNVLCVTETCDLLKGSKLQSLVLRRIKSKEHVNGVCKLLNQNNETLSSLDFVYCKLPSTALEAICDSLFTSIQAHGIQHFSIKNSDILENTEVPPGFLSFLSSGRSLRLLNFCDNHLGTNFAKSVLDTLLDVSSGLSVLDLSENNISGWLSSSSARFSNCVPSPSRIDKSLWSLRVLNLRGNNLQADDASSLKQCLLQMPNLESLDVSDNPIEDGGLRILIPYLVELSERDVLFELKVEKCDLSCDGVTQLLTSFTHVKGLNVLSIADNDLGSQVAVPLAKFLGQSCIGVLNIEDIELGSSGFLELTKELPEKVKLVDINISKNRGGSEAARFVSELILRAPELVQLNAGYNLMTSESLVAICSALKLSKGKLKKLDLTGNTGCYQPTHASILAHFQACGRPIVVLPLLPATVVPYDDDV